MKNIEILDEFLANVTTQITQCNFDKAKDLCKREKILTSAGLYKEIFNLLPSIISVEKCYSDLGFLSSRSKILVKKENTLKSAFTEIKSQCEKIQTQDNAEYERILSEIMYYTQIRCQMIDLYDTMYTFASFNKHWKMPELIKRFQSLIDLQIVPYMPKTLTCVKAYLEMELCCLSDLLNAQFYLENWNLLSCVSHITSLKSRLVVWEKTIHKETWKVNFLRSNSLPELYRWMIKFKTFILEKFSLYFFMIIQSQTSASDLKMLCNKHRLEFLQWFQTLSKKFGHEATNILLIFDACGIKNWSGPGYRCPFKKNKSESPNNSYYIMLKYPDKLNEPCNLLPTIRKILVEHFSDILFLDKVVCRYLPSENCTYFVTSIEERVTLVSYYNSRKDDKRTDIDNYMLELACMIRCHRVFLSLNPSGR